MKKPLVIIATVAILGILAVSMVPLSAKNLTKASATTGLVASNPSSATTNQPTSQPATSASQTTATQPQMMSGTNMHTLKDGTFTGSSSSNQFGDVQIKLTISGGKITDVSALSYPSSDRHSLQVSQYSIPQLKQEVLASQSAIIDSISGASYTSQSYVESLQSAINQAKA